MRQMEAQIKQLMERSEAAQLVEKHVEAAVAAKVDEAMEKLKAGRLWSHAMLRVRS